MGGNTTYAAYHDEMGGEEPTHTFPLTLSPMAEKCRPHASIGLGRPRATTIGVGIYARRRVLSLVPAYEVAVCKWGGAP